MRTEWERTGIALMTAGAVFAGYGVYLPIKAAVADVLLARAWAAADEDRGAPRPWPWAETRPVARIVAPKRHAASLVMAAPPGRMPAFGPVNVAGTSVPGTPGHSLVAAWRGGQLGFVRFLALGEDLRVERPGGEIVRYIVVQKRVLNTAKEKIAFEPANDILTLVTRYPFDGGDSDGPLRFVVTAVRDEP